MEFNEFIDVVKELVKSRLPEKYRDAEFFVRENNKINEHYTGLTAIAPGENVSPSVNLDLLYGQYKSEMGINEIADRAAEILQMDTGIDFDLTNLLHYDKEKVFIRVCSVEQNESLLKEIPHQTMEDLAITYHILAGSREEAFGSTIITNPLLEQYGISEEQLHQDAMGNSPRLFPVSVTPMEDLLHRLMKEEPDYREMSDAEINDLLEDTGPEGELSMYVVSNDMTLNGAAAMFYPHVMEQLADRLGNDLVILPSSVHESATRFAV